PTTYKKDIIQDFHLEDARRLACHLTSTSTRVRVHYSVITAASGKVDANGGPMILTIDGSNNDDNIARTERSSIKGHGEAVASRENQRRSWDIELLIILTSAVHRERENHRSNRSSSSSPRRRRRVPIRHRFCRSRVLRFTACPTRPATDYLLQALLPPAINHHYA
ncbi:hypothetical protein V1477_003095, partial [Vespula maculifrons]